MKLQDVLNTNTKYTVQQIASDKDLAAQIQSILINVKLLDPPADGLFGRKSTVALRSFQILKLCWEDGDLGAATAKELIQSTGEDLSSTPIKLQNFVGTNLKYSFDAVGDNLELAKQIQICLIRLKRLDPPADGKFGPITIEALKQFQLLTKINEPDYLGSETAEKLIETKLEDLPARTAPLNLGNDLASCIIKYMQSKGYHIATGSKRYNIVYVEGMDKDGSLNSDEPNCFNDRRILIQVINGVPVIVGNWQATTEPGSYYTYNPMNPKGAARILFGQYKAWKVGSHGTAEPHQALVQRENLTVCRDFNEDFKRTGDKHDSGLFYVNQHWGFDYPYNNVSRASAGCLVGRSRQGHREFMSLIKQDDRYQTNNEYLFYTAIIPGDDLVAKFPPKS
ncbi:MAG: peptidoglycan-binding protein [Crinalium sp.]